MVLIERSAAHARAHARRRAMPCLLAAAALAAPNPAMAGIPSTLYVAPAGDDANDGLTPGAPLRNVQTGIDRVMDDGRIMVLRGTYVASIIIDHPVRIIGEPGVVLDGATDVRVIENTADGALLANLTIANGSSFEGAGVHNTGRLDLTNVTVRDCRATILIFDTLGGGIYNDGTLAMTNCTVAGNRSEPHGTLVGGTQKGLGGGIYHAGGSLILRFSTIAGNVAAIHSDAGSGIPAGGGLYVAGGTVSMQHTIIADNTSEYSLDGSGPLEGPDCFGSVASTGYNIIFDTADCDVTGEQAGLMLDVAAGLDPSGVGYHGGLVPTVALLSTSPAIDAGDPSFAFPVDARAYVRPIDGDGDGRFIVDLGAFEYDSVYPGDFDGDEVWSDEDYARLLTCFTGPGVTAAPPACTPRDALVADLLRDGSVDLSDFWRFTQLKSALE